MSPATFGGCRSCWSSAYRTEDSRAERELIAQLGRLCDDRISLERLSRESTSELAANLLGPDPVAADVERIAGEAEGNPLFVEELVAATGVQGIPETLRDLMLARASRHSTTTPGIS